MQLVTKAKLIGAVIVVAFLFGLGFTLGRRSVRPLPAQTVTVTKEVPVEKVVDRVVTVTQTRVVKVPGKPDVTVITTTDTNSKADEKDTVKEVPVRVTTTDPPAPAFTSTSTFTATWTFSAVAGADLNLREGLTPMLGLGVDRHFGHFLLGAEALSDFKSSAFLAVRAGVEF